jgi:hypothetical protein
MVPVVDKDRPVLDDRFWSKVNKTETCWLWTASIDLKGYGQFGLGGSGNIGLVHRLSWSAVNGPIPKDKEILHRCDHPACVRPDHMRLGTHAENMAEMSERRRSHHGALHKRSHLNDEAIKVIRFLAARGVQCKQLSEAYGISLFGISCIVRGTTWKHLPGPFTFNRQGGRWIRRVYAELPKAS